ncbi:replication-associated recombination protein A [Candidatus Mycalebacterium sp.]
MENTPLAERMRPKSLDEIAGQNHLLGQDGVLRGMARGMDGRGGARSMILWGPPGTGKTTLARVLTAENEAEFIHMDAVFSGVKEIRDALSRAAKVNGGAVLFIDEIHRFNKSQQATLLKSVEEGEIALIGATTENPSFEVISPLLSRCAVYRLEPLGENDLSLIINRALEKDPALKSAKISEDARNDLIALCGGDARALLNALEIAVSLSNGEVDSETVRNVYQKGVRYDKDGDEHYNTISAFIKSVRASDPDSALYYLARMLQAGEEPLFIARRLIVLASEDIGNAEPYALTLATDCFTAVNYIGMPEARIVLAQTAAYLASCPRSNAAYSGLRSAEADVKKHPDLEIPMHIRNAPTRLMKGMGYGKGYKYPHDEKDAFTEQDNLPEKLKNRIYYKPSERGREAALKKYLDEKWKKRK